MHSRGQARCCLPPHPQPCCHVPAGRPPPVPHFWASLGAAARPPSTPHAFTSCTRPRVAVYAGGPHTIHSSQAVDTPHKTVMTAARSSSRPCGVSPNGGWLAGWLAGQVRCAGTPGHPVTNRSDTQPVCCGNHQVGCWRRYSHGKSACMHVALVHLALCSTAAPVGDRCRCCGESTTHRHPYHTTSVWWHSPAPPSCTRCSRWTVGGTTHTMAVGAAQPEAAPLPSLPMSTLCCKHFPLQEAHSYMWVRQKDRPAPERQSPNQVRVPSTVPTMSNNRRQTLLRVGGID